MIEQIKVKNNENIVILILKDEDKNVAKLIIRI